MDRGPGAVKRPSSPSRFPERLAQVRREVCNHHCPRLLPVGELPPATASFLQGPQLVRYRRAAAGSWAATARWAGRKTVLPFRFARYLEGKLIYPPRQGWGADFTKACNRKRLSAAVTGLRAGVLEFPNNRTAISWKCQKGNTFEYILMNQMELPDCLPPW